MSLDTTTLRAEQAALAARISLTDEVPAMPRLIGGADISASRFDPGRRVFAAIVVLEWPGLREVARAGAVMVAPIPYIPGLLGFREVPALAACWAQLADKPELLFLDGQGVLHPRRFGIACHAGIALDVPTIGVAKSRLVGEIGGPCPEAAGASLPIAFRGERLGALLRSRHGARPLYISPGHRVSVAGALGWVRATLRGRRLPEPTRLAHLAAGALRQADRLP
jgi:deoxyribonuclease V